MDQHIRPQLQRAIEAIELNGGSPYIGEQVTQFEHSIQAAWFAERHHNHEDVILASLLHDIGHYAYKTTQPQMSTYGAINHEWIGARLAKEFGFSNKIAKLIGYHVMSKRYLAGKSQGYYDLLSDASKTTMAYQGGPLNTEEVFEFEALEIFKEALQVRTSDEQGKVVGFELPEFTYYVGKMANHLSLHKVNCIKPKTVTLISHVAKLDDHLTEILTSCYDLVLYMPLPEVMTDLKPHINPHNLAMPDYFFSSDLDEEVYQQLKISFLHLQSTTDDYIHEFLDLITSSCCSRYLIIVHDVWFKKLTNYFCGNSFHLDYHLPKYAQVRIAAQDG